MESIKFLLIATKTKYLANLISINESPNTVNLKFLLIETKA